MKKLTLLSAFAALLLLSGCGMGTTSGLPAGGSSVTTPATTSVLGSTGTNVLGTLLKSVLGNTTSQNTIVGTWTYSAPKVTFQSESILAQVGSSLASSKIESVLGNQLKKLGFQSGKTTMTFLADGTCQMVRSGKTLPGTYSYNAKTGVMTIQGTFGVANISPYVSVMGNEMYMLFQSDKLLGVMNTLTSATSATSTLSNLLGNYSGLQLGWTMTRVN